MNSAIQKGEFLEYGEHDGHIYGTRLSTIKEINREGVVSILDVEPNSLKILRNKTYSPLVVYIAPGTGSNQNPHDVSIIYHIAGVIKYGSYIQSSKKSKFSNNLTFLILKYF